MDPTDDTFGHLVACLTDALGEQAELHVELAKAELSRDVHSFLHAAAPLLIGLPILATGYLLTSVGMALALTPALGEWGAFALLGLGNLLAGALVVRHAVARLRTRPVLNPTVVHELERSARSIVAALRADDARDVLPAS